MNARERRRKRRRLAAGAGLGIGVALGASATAEAADFTVTNLNDAGAGSLRQAILDSNANPGADRVLFQSSLSGTVTLTSGELMVTGATEILGPGADRIAVSGNKSSRILYLKPVTADLITISGLTLEDGKANTSGGAIFNTAANLTVERSVISGNAAKSSDPGGGIYAGQGPLTVRDSTITGNSAYRGGGIDALRNSAQQPVTIENSTIAGNTATLLGGGIAFQDVFNFGVHLDVRSSTISGNTVSQINTYGGGGIFLHRGQTSLANTIVADNAANTGPDIRSYVPGFPVSATFSLIENPAATTITGGPNITGQDPKLGPLTDNGGPTPTEALGEGSPAIDQGLASGADQRGAPRPFDFVRIALAGSNQADIGAYERVLCGGKPVNRVGTSGSDTLTGTAGDDGILGLGGSDTLKGVGAGDGLCGGGGRDKLKGGKGKDKLLGQAGRDKLKGGKGNDTLKGGKGKDVLIGGKGRDKLKGGKGKDKQKQ